MRERVIEMMLWVAMAMAAPLWAGGAEKVKGEEEVSAEKEVAPGERMVAAMQGYELGMRDYFAKRRAAKLEEERAELVQPDAAAAAREVLAAVETGPDDPKAREAVFWAARAAVASRDGAVLGEVLAVLGKSYVDAEGVEEVCLMLGNIGDGGGEVVGLLEKIRKGSGHKPARGAAALALGKIRAEGGDDKGAAALFEEVVEGYPDAEVGGEMLADLAEGELFAMRGLRVGAEAPEIEGVKADGEEFKLSAYRGKVVVVEFFGNWSGPCRSMYQGNRALVEKMAGRPFALVGVNSDTKSKLEEIVKDGTVTWECVWDGGSTAGEIASRWKVRAWPTRYVLDGEGVIRFVGLRGEELEHAVVGLLEEAEEEG